MKIPRLSSTLGTVQLRSRTQRDLNFSRFTTIQTVKSFISALARVTQL